MTKVELVDGGVYWVRPSGHKLVNGQRVQVVCEEPRLAQFGRMEMSHGEDWTTFYYFGTDFSDMPEDVIVVAGPLEIPPPPEPVQESGK